MRSFEHRIDAMTCDSGDKHVLAAAVEGKAEAIITFNTGDFSSESTSPHGIDVLHPMTSCWTYTTSTPQESKSC